MVVYARRRRMGAVGWMVAALGVLVAPFVTIFLVNVMFGVEIPFTLTNYLLMFALYVVVLFVVGIFSMAGHKVG